MKNRIKEIIIVVEMIITGVISAYAATVINSSEVSYTSNGQTTLQGAIDDLYTKATPDNMLTLKVLASKNGICIKRNNKVSCFKANNYNVEKDHIQQVFSDISCEVELSYVNCDASDFCCDVYSSGGVLCDDLSDDSSCTVYSDGTVECY